jgi:branched-chain amino acid transport system ATP-binding protein
VSYLTLENVTISYGEVVAVRSASFLVAEHEAVALIGANGAGKTTVLRAIAGSMRPSQGIIRFEGETIDGLAPERIARKGIALVPEGRRIFGTLTVEENLRLGLNVRSQGKATQHDIDRTLELFPVLKDRLTDWAGELSGGQQQQLALARALVARPKLLLLDEPSLGLAPQVVDEVFEFLQRLREEGQTVLLVEQNAIRAVDFADRVYVLQRGRIIREAAAGELSDRMSELAELYLGEGRESELLDAE